MQPDAKNVGMHLDNAPSGLRDLLGRARQLAEIDSAVRDWAGTPLNQHLRVANVRQGALVIYIENAAAYTALRYRQQELLERLRQQCKITISKIEIKTMPSPQKPSGD
jgi:hypothetical protein